MKTSFSWSCEKLVLLGENATKSGGPIVWKTTSTKYISRSRKTIWNWSISNKGAIQWFGNLYRPYKATGRVQWTNRPAFFRSWLYSYIWFKSINQFWLVDPCEKLKRWFQKARMKRSISSKRDLAKEYPELAKQFEINPYVTQQELDQLVNSTGLNGKAIRRWFQGRQKKNQILVQKFSRNSDPRTARSSTSPQCLKVQVNND